MNEYTVNLRVFFGNSELEIESPVDDHNFKLVAMNLKLSESQAKRLTKSIIEICENVFLAERGVDFEISEEAERGERK